MVWKLVYNDSAILKSHTDPFSIFEKLPERLKLKQSAIEVLWEYFEVLLDALEVVAQITGIL
jgi:hypothetical protein